MFPSAYTEDTLVQQTTAEYLERQLGWRSVYAYNNEDFRLGSLLDDVVVSSVQNDAPAPLILPGLNLKSMAIDRNITTFSKENESCQAMITTVPPMVGLWK